MKAFFAASMRSLESGAVPLGLRREGLRGHLEGAGGPIVEVLEGRRAPAAPATSRVSRRNADALAWASSTVCVNRASPFLEDLRHLPGRRGRSWSRSGRRSRWPAPSTCGGRASGCRPLDALDVGLEDPDDAAPAGELHRVPGVPPGVDLDRVAVREVDDVGPRRGRDRRHRHEPATRCQPCAPHRSLPSSGDGPSAGSQKMMGSR